MPCARNCLQLGEISFVGPCASSNLLLHLDASSISSPMGSLVSEWRDQSGHGHHARRRGGQGDSGTEGDGGGVPLALPSSAALEVDDASEILPPVDDGGSPRLVREKRSGRLALSWEYSLGGGFLEAAGLSVGPTDSMTVFVVAGTRRDGWPRRGSKVKPIYCLGEPAFWAGTLCVAGVVGNASSAGYGGRGQPGEGEYMEGLTGDAMGDGGLHILAATVDGKEGLYRAYVDGLPALVPSFLSKTTPSVGVAQLGGSSTSRSRRFHGLIAEVVHYNNLLSTRQMAAIGHYLQHKYRIRGAYTDERTALSEAAGGRGGGSGKSGATGTAALAAAGALGDADGHAADGGGASAVRTRIQLMLPPESGCLTHRGALKKISLEACDDEASAAQSWTWEASTLELRWGTDATQCLNWMEDEASFGVWPCEFAESEFEFQPLAHRFCLVSAPTRCVSQLLASAPMLLRAANADGTPVVTAPPNAGNAASSDTSIAKCLQFVKAEAELEHADCDESESRQRFEFDAPSGEFHVSNDKRLCVDFFRPANKWGVWGCHHANNEQFRSQAPRADAYCVRIDGTSHCVSVYRPDSVMRLVSEGEALCLEFSAPLRPLVRAACGSSPRQLWRYERGALRYARDASLCIDRFSSEGGQWGVWTCEGPSKPNQHFVVNPMADGAKLESADGGGGGGGRGGQQVVVGTRMCVQLPGNNMQCVQRAAEDGAMALALPGDAHCMELSNERLTPKAKVRRVADADEDDDDEMEDGLEEEQRDDGNEVSTAPCSDGEALPQRWRYRDDGTFGPLRNETLCLELTSTKPVTVPCVASKATGSAPQSFHWKASSGHYCTSVLSATHFHIKRCLRAAPGWQGISVAFRPRGGKRGLCLTAMGTFRMLEAAPCAAADPAQQWVYHAKTQSFHGSRDAGQCLRWFEEARSFAAWACELGDGAAAASFRFRPALKEDKEAAGHTQHAFCMDRPGGVASACLLVVAGEDA